MQSTTQPPPLAAPWRLLDGYQPDANVGDMGLVTNVSIVNNTMVSMNGAVEYAIWLFPNLSGAVVKNNAIYDHGNSGEPYIKIESGASGLDIGYRLPAFCTSVGRVLLSRLPDDELVAALGKMDLVQMTPVTVTDKKKLQKAIIAGRAQGYSLVDREAEPGFRSISVPVRRYDGAIVAAINMGAHVDRVSSAEMVERFLPRLLEAAASVKSMLV